MDFSPELILKDAIQNDKITIEKCRKLALLAGAAPQSFFINKNKKSIIIDTKASLVNHFFNESHEGKITNYLQVSLQQLLRVGKNIGGNDELQNIKYNTTIAFVLAVFLYILNKGLTKYRLYKIIHKDEKTIQDKVQSIELFNDGYYNGCLAHDKSLHEIFKKSYMYNETVEKLRYRLLTEWETSYIGQHYLMNIHLIRNN